MRVGATYADVGIRSITPTSSMNGTTDPPLDPDTDDDVLIPIAPVLDAILKVHERLHPAGGLQLGRRVSRSSVIFGWDDARPAA